ncbi:MAG: ArsR family transcriptional regulator, partial [Anaerolineales bacterium]|nr:ArsR family transcriptional regulator [Anaerolineales bacterium]
LKLPPLPFGATREFFPDYTQADRVKIYSIWGGIPAYWERLNPDISVFENLAEQLAPSNTWMLDEPRLLLQDFVTDPYNYVGIMRAIADGKHAIGDIAKRIGLTTSATSMYLSILRDTGFVVRRVPVTKRGTESRLGRYYVTDPYLRFYYRFLAAYQSKLALGKQKQMVEVIEEDLPQFVEDNMWLELCSNWLLLASEHDAVSLPVEEVGSEWKRSYTIDVVGMDQQAKYLVLGSCFWSEKPDVTKALDLLLKRSTAVVPDQEDWSTEYLLFTAQSWTETERAQAQAYIESRASRRGKINPIGVRLLDLEQVDEDLTMWTIGMYEPVV